MNIFLNIRIVSSRRHPGTHGAYSKAPPWTLLLDSGRIMFTFWFELSIFARQIVSTIKQACRA